MHPSQRLAFNLGFQKRAAEILMTKEALRGGMAGKLLGSTAGAARLQTAMPGASTSRIMSGIGTAARGSAEAKGYADAIRAARGAKAMPVGRKPWDPVAARQRSELAQLGPSRPGGFNIPQKSGWGADNINKATGAVWNNRTNPQRAGIVGAGVYGYGAHERARAQQGAYDQFAEAHPIMAGLGRFMGVNRPRYGQALANNALYLPGIS